jgi:hypothetical protein
MDRMIQPAPKQPFMDPRGLPGLMHPAIQVDRMQRLAIMMAMMVLGAPQVYGCCTSEASCVPRALLLPCLDMFPGVTPSKVIEVGSREMTSIMDDWLRLKAVHCYATQSVFSYTCNHRG